MITDRSFPDLVRASLPRQRWYSGTEEPASLTVMSTEVLSKEWPALVAVIVQADGHDYQLLVGLRPAGEEPPEFLHGHDYAVLGEVETDLGPALAYDALIDHDLALFLLDVVSDGRETANFVRPVTAEQSNSSVVYEDRLILKVFRRLHGGANPDAEVTLALDDVGFNHIAAPLAVWQGDDVDRAILQPFLAGGTEGWALALTSIRDLYASPGDPASAGGDFASESTRLGGMTGRMHVALGEAFGVFDASTDDWANGMRIQLETVAREEQWRSEASVALDRLEHLDDTGCAIRVHGDYHLGQVMRTDIGWFVLDFEGEPARPVDERRQPTSPLKDVAGMLRSFHYATEVVLMERDDAERAGLDHLGAAWEERNRAAFLDGYRRTKGIDDLVPSDDVAFARLLTVFELDKAIYELAYERAHRPDWEPIPQRGIHRLVTR